MSEAVVDDIVAMLPPLLQSLEALSFVARHLNPPDFGRVMQAAGTPDRDLQAIHARLADWPGEFADIKTALQAAGDAALTAFKGLRSVEQGHGDLVAVFRALRYLPRAQEALYPLAVKFPPVSSFFTAPALRDDAELEARLAAPRRPDTGIIHHHNEAGSRGGFSLYVPEYYTPGRAWPLVMALHGGAGNGRGFLWSWLRDARSHGAILVAPTATGNDANDKTTWALMGEDTDTPNLARILAFVRDRWNIDPDRLLLTGMSDGGTFTLLSGLDDESPFTHFAPVASSFHPLLLTMTEPSRVMGLPIYLVHGALDWMFPVSMARGAQQALTAAGAQVTYREIADLSHVYPHEEGSAILDWFLGAGAGRESS
jgi:phospholipase/carboxylesterase